MTFSYKLSEGLPNERDQVRLMLGDTDENNFILHDEEIDFYLSQEPNIYFAAAGAAYAMMTRLQGAYLEDQKVGETRIRARRINELKLLVDQWKARGATHMLPDAGGIYVTDRQVMDSRTDLLQNVFRKGMDDYPGTTKDSVPRADEDEF